MLLLLVNTQVEQMTDNSQRHYTILLNAKLDFRKAFGKGCHCQSRYIHYGKSQIVYTYIRGKVIGFVIVVMDTNFNIPKSGTVGT